MTRILPILATLVLAGFLGILLWEVWRLDLTLVIVATLALVLIDLALTLRAPPR